MTIDCQGTNLPRSIQSSMEFSFSWLEDWWCDWLEGAPNSCCASCYGDPIEEKRTSQSISFLSLVKNCNHKGLGIYYLLSAFIFGISGTLISVLIRIELYSSGNRIISPENQNFYNISIITDPRFLPGTTISRKHVIHYRYSPQKKIIYF